MTVQPILDGMQPEKPHAYSSSRALRTLSQLSRSVSRAESRDELLDVAGGCLRDLGFRSYLAELEGDHVRLLGDKVETESLARVETILGRELTSLHLRTNAIPCIHAAATRRSPATSLDLATSFMSLVPHLSASERVALRNEIGSGPFVAVPVERGDDLVAVLVAWRGGVEGSTYCHSCRWSPPSWDPPGGVSALRPPVAGTRTSTGQRRS